MTRDSISSGLIILALGTQAVQAGVYSVNDRIDAPRTVSYQSRSLVLSAAVGGLWGGSGQTQTLLLTPRIQKSYIDSGNSTNSVVDGEIFIGLQQALQHSVNLQLGVAIASTSNADFSGVIWDDALPVYNNYVYNYGIRHHAATLKGTFLLSGHTLMPWISASGGIGCNRAYGFDNQPTIPEAIASPNFSANSTSTFTYTLGAGLQHQLSPNFQVGLGYEFANWGKAELGRAPGQTLGQGPSLSHYYTNALLANLTYIR